MFAPEDRAFRAVGDGAVEVRALVAEGRLEAHGVDEVLVVVPATGCVRIKGRHD